MELVAVGQRHADGFAVANEDPRDFGFAADLGTEVAGADASACVRPSMPPRTYAHTPRAPPLSPMTWWKSTYAVPGIEGLAIAPMTASVASVPFSSSDSNQRSRIGRAAPVMTSTASPARLPAAETTVPARASSAGRVGAGAAGRAGSSSASH